MKVAGIVAEYNPFHLGHDYHIRQTRQLTGATHVAVVMSGNFVQRAEPAIAEKNARAAIAVGCGADLVLELPVAWACATAQTFAFGAVSLLDGLGCVDTLSFGSECGDTAALSRLAKGVSGEPFNAAVRAQLKSGLPLAAIRERCAVSLFGRQTALPLTTPNDTLAVEYLSALGKLGSCIEPFAVKRIGAGHDSERADGTYRSASQIRSMIRNGEAFSAFLPQASAEGLEEEIASGRAPADYGKLETAVLYALRRMPPEEFRALRDISEGIENRIIKAAMQTADLETLCLAAKTKRYSHARIRRIVLSAFLGIRAADSDGAPLYARVLAANEKGMEVLKAAAARGTVPAVVSASQIAKLGGRAAAADALESRTDAIFALCLPNPLSHRPQSGVKFAPVSNIQSTKRVTER